MKTATRVCAAVLAVLLASSAAWASWHGSSRSARPSPASASASASAAASASASASASAKARADFCTDLYGFQTSADRSFDLALRDVVKHGSKKSRKKAARLIHGMAAKGRPLAGRLPREVDAARRTIGTAAKKAAAELDDGAPLEKAAPRMLTKKVLAARKTLIAYRGPC